jgi:predicted flap endonuclease-1-like 5' DNA nuclease
MRLDYGLYIVAALLFTITVFSAVLIVENERSLWVVTTALLGILALGLGYYQRPRATVSTQLPPPPVTEPTAVEMMPQETQVEKIQVPVEEKIEVKDDTIEAPVEAAALIEVPPVIEAPVQPSNIETPQITQPPTPQATEAVPVETVVESPLIKIKGIGEKRANQLNARGINTIDELAKASAQDIAKSLKISSKIVDKWVAGAKDLIK